MSAYGDPYFTDRVTRHHAEQCDCGGAGFTDPDGTRICIACGRYQEAPRRDARMFEHVRELMRADVPPRRTRIVAKWRGER